ncbi:MAG: OB-fold putative lipoprotein [Bacteroidales bacterium]|nr:OB-fold putative lipoprotein [Bacteroidales bacterium]
MKRIYTILLIALIINSCGGRQSELISVTAKQLVIDYQSSTQYGNRKYRGNALIVEGTIAEYYRNKKNEITIILREKNQKTGVKCNLVRSDKQITKPLKYGSKIRIKGVCLGLKEDNIILQNCFIMRSK